eukprot:TRINITY_DN4649_c0_g3_i1.p1 TRINITY_DN4649_c0_g3~~TRINITY_DN4649_c0_g3_i1.p1  ORF type:complete len:1489 (+),score=463.05 TRINITY_DN4649_c0_g3_i1:83-4549(+)
MEFSPSVLGLGVKKRPNTGNYRKKPRLRPVSSHATRRSSRPGTFKKKRLSIDKTTIEYVLKSKSEATLPPVGNTEENDVKSWFRDFIMDGNSLEAPLEPMLRTLPDCFESTRRSITLKDIKPLPDDSHDISYRSDKPGHGLYGKSDQKNSPNIPSSIISPRHHILRTEPCLPTGEKGFDANEWKYDDNIKEWVRTEFPSLKPSGRREVVLLEKWLQEMLNGINVDSLPPVEVVENAQLIYSSCFHELMRQVSVHCVERGSLLDKIWKTYVGLFERLLQVNQLEVNAAMESMRKNEEDCQRTLEEQETEHKDEMAKLQARFDNLQFAHEHTKSEMDAMKDAIQKRDEELERVRKMLRDVLHFEHQRIPMDMDLNRSIESSIKNSPKPITSRRNSQKALLVEALSMIKDQDKPIDQVRFQVNTGEVIEIPVSAFTGSDSNLQCKAISDQLGLNDKPPLERPFETPEEAKERQEYQIRGIALSGGFRTREKPDPQTSAFSLDVNGLDLVRVIDFMQNGKLGIIDEDELSGLMTTAKKLKNKALQNAITERFQQIERENKLNNINRLTDQKHLLDAQRKVHGLEQEIDRLNNELKSARQIIEQVKRENLQLGIEKGMFEKQRDELREENIRLKAELERALAKLEKATNQLANFKKNHETAENDNLEWMSRLGDLKRELGASESGREELLREIERWKTRHLNSQDEIVELKREIERLKQRLSEGVADKIALEQMIKVLKSTLNKKFAEIKRSLDDNNASSQKHIDDLMKPICFEKGIQTDPVLFGDINDLSTNGSSLKAKSLKRRRGKKSIHINVKGGRGAGRNTSPTTVRSEAQSINSVDEDWSDDDLFEDSVDSKTTARRRKTHRKSKAMLRKKGKKQRTRQSMCILPSNLDSHEGINSFPSITEVRNDEESSEGEGEGDWSEDSDGGTEERPESARSIRGEKMYDPALLERPDSARARVSSSYGRHNTSKRRRRIGAREENVRRRRYKKHFKKPEPTKKRRRNHFHFPHKLANLFSGPIPRKVGQPISRKVLFKVVQQIYREKIEADLVDDQIDNPRQTLAEFVYDWHLNKYGLWKLAEQHMIKMVNGLWKFRLLYKFVENFGSFLGVYDERPPSDLDLYLDIYKMLQQSNVGPASKPKNLKDNVWPEEVPLIRALAVVSDLFQSTKGAVSKEVKLLQDRLDQLSHRVGDHKWIDEDVFLLEALEAAKDANAQASITLAALFTAGDVNNDGVLTIEEFTSIIHHVDDCFPAAKILRMHKEAQGENQRMYRETFVEVALKYGVLGFNSRGKNLRLPADEEGTDPFVILQDQWRATVDDYDRMRAEVNDENDIREMDERLEQFESLLDAGQDGHAAWLCYRMLMTEARKLSAPPPSAIPEDIETSGPSSRDSNPVPILDDDHPTSATILGSPKQRPISPQSPASRKFSMLGSSRPTTPVSGGRRSSAVIMPVGMLRLSEGVCSSRASIHVLPSSRKSMMTHRKSMMALKRPN